jgi:hypothetical protein
MSDRTFLRLLAPLLLLLGGLAPAGASAPAAPVAKWDDYKVIVERNIFLKERAAPVRPAAPLALPKWSTIVTPIPRPEHDIVLVGTLRQHGVASAFLENTRTDGTFRVTVGDPVAEGRIMRIGLDSVLYESGGRGVVIEVGHALDGELPSRTPSPTPAGISGLPPLPAGRNAPEPAQADRGARQPAAAPTPTTSPPAAVNASSEDENAILQRLRQQREKELKGQ